MRSRLQCRVTAAAALQQTLRCGRVITARTGDPKLAGRPKAEYRLRKHRLRKGESQELQIFLWLHQSPLKLESC